MTTTRLLHIPTNKLLQALHNGVYQYLEKSKKSDEKSWGKVFSGKIDIMSFGKDGINKANKIMDVLTNLQKSFGSFDSKSDEEVNVFQSKLLFLLIAIFKSNGHQLKHEVLIKLIGISLVDFSMKSSNIEKNISDPDAPINAIFPEGAVRAQWSNVNAKCAPGLADNVRLSDAIVAASEALLKEKGYEKTTFKTLESALSDKNKNAKYIVGCLDQTTENQTHSLNL